MPFVVAVASDITHEYGNEVLPVGMDSGPAGLSIVHVPPGRESLSDTPVIVFWLGLFTLIAPVTTNSVPCPRWA